MTLQKNYKSVLGHETMNRWGPIFKRINTMLENFTIKLLPKLKEVQAKGDIWWNNAGGGWKGQKHGGDFTTNDSCILEPIIKTIHFIMNLIHKS
jgi:hypothetical protein